MEQLAINADFERAAAGGNQRERRNPIAELEDFSRQTDGFRGVVSDRAVFDPDLEFHRVLLSMTRLAMAHCRVKLVADRVGNSLLRDAVDFDQGNTARVARPADDGGVSTRREGREDRRFVRVGRRESRSRDLIFSRSLPIVVARDEDFAGVVQFLYWIPPARD